MRDSERTTWTYPISQQNSAADSYPESHPVTSCHHSPSSQMLAVPLSQAPLPSFRRFQQPQERFTSASPQPAALTLREPSPGDLDRLNEERRLQQHQEQEDQVYRSLVPAVSQNNQHRPPSFTMMSETWFGLVQTPRDAYLLLEACRLGMLQRITRRLTDLERSQVIRPGAVFVWEEREAGIKRWTDHVRWSPSRVSGAFLIYSELLSASTRELHPHPSDPLLKQSFSSTTLEGDRLHLIAYYSKAALDSGRLPTPSADERLRTIIVPPGIYPDHRATGGVEDQNIRDRQRTNLIPRTSAPSLRASQSTILNSLESSNEALNSSNLPQKSTSQMTEIVYHEQTSLTGQIQWNSSRSRSSLRLGGDLKYPTQPNYLGGLIYPANPPAPENQILSTSSSKWDQYQQSMLDWTSNSGSSAPASEPSTYPRTSTPGTAPTTIDSPSGASTLPALGSWQAGADADRAPGRRLSASNIPEPQGSTSTASNSGHSFHPYSRVSDRERKSERRVDMRTQQDSRRLSYEPMTAPGTPITGSITLPSIHNSSLIDQRSSPRYLPIQGSSSIADSPSLPSGGTPLHNQRELPSSYPMISPRFSVISPPLSSYPNLAASRPELSSYSKPHSPGITTSGFPPTAALGQCPSPSVRSRSRMDEDSLLQVKPGSMLDPSGYPYLGRPSSVADENGRAERKADEFDHVNNAPTHSNN